MDWEEVSNELYRSILVEATAAALRSCQKNLSKGIPGKFWLVQNLSNQYIYEDFMGDPGVFGQSGTDQINLVWHHIADEIRVNAWINHFSEIFNIVWSNEVKSRGIKC